MALQVKVGIRLPIVPAGVNSVGVSKGTTRKSYAGLQALAWPAAL